MIQKIQQILKKTKIDGWLFTNYDNQDPFCELILGIKGQATRRWYYYLPAQGDCKGIITPLEKEMLAKLHGTITTYKDTEERDNWLATLKGKTVAMQYSPQAKNEDLSRLDAGTYELLNSLGIDIVSSEGILQELFMTLDEKQLTNHKRTGKIIHTIKDEAFKLIGDKIRCGEEVTEQDVCTFITRRIAQEGLTMDGSHPIVAVNENASIPHHDCTQAPRRIIKKGDLVLIDLWARKEEAMSIYHDITWMGYVGKNIPEKYAELFSIIAQARDEGVKTIKKAFSEKKNIQGKEVDAAVRRVITEAGYQEAFIHGTGHAIDIRVHGVGVNMSSKEERKLKKGSLFSIEPGVYIEKKIGLRTEIDAYIDKEGNIRVSGPVQKKIHNIL